MSLIKLSGKRGMAIAQVFIFILAALTFSLIMIFGYQAIDKFINSGKEVQMVEFENNLQNEIKKIYTESGSLRIEKFYVPGDFEKICFINLDYASDKIGLEADALCAESPAACGIWKEAAKAQQAGKSGYDFGEENVFLEPSQAGQHPIKTYKIALADENEVEVGFLCLPIKKGSFSLVLEGKGDHAELSDYQP